MNRKLSADFVTDLGTTWSDYDGDDVYGDFTVTGTTVADTNSYESGLWRRMKVGTNFVPEYLHNDHLGTLRATTNGSGAAGASRVFTAFGERITTTTDRFGYVGAWGYQAATSDTPGDPYVTGFPFLHVGARYYDPSSGRFLQRDPIGIRGGRSVYAYVGSRPTSSADPSGLQEGMMYLPVPLIEPPHGNVQSPEDIAAQLQRERVFQIVLGTCINVVGAFNPITTVIAIVVDVAASIYAATDPIVVPTNAPKTAPKPPGGGAG